VPPYTHGSYSYWIVWLLIPLLFFTFFYCVYNSYTLIRSFAALQHLNFAGISLEFYIYWHMLPGISTYQWRFITWKYHLYHRNGKTGFPGFNDAYHCILWLHLHVVHCDVIVEIPTGYTHCNMYTNGIHTFSPSLSKYGVYNISPLIVLCTYSQLCAMHLFSLAFAASYRD